MQPEIAAQLKTADALGGVDEQAESHSSARTGSFRHASEVPLVAENAASGMSCDLNNRRHR